MNSIRRQPTLLVGGMLIRIEAQKNFYPRPGFINLLGILFTAQFGRFIVGNAPPGPLKSSEEGIMLWDLSRGASLPIVREELPQASDLELPQIAHVILEHSFGTDDIFASDMRTAIPYGEYGIVVTRGKDKAEVLHEHRSVIVDALPADDVRLRAGDRVICRHVL